MSADFDAVHEYLGQVIKDGHIVSIPVNNDTVLRESASLPALFDVLALLGEPGSITFYGHTKGVTHTKAPDDRRKAIELWTVEMHKQLLGRIDDVEKMFDNYDCVGAFRRRGQFSNMPKESNWHYSGTFYWFDTVKGYNRFNHVRSQPLERYTAEALPSLLFSLERSGCIAYDDPLSLYSLPYITKLIDGSIQLPNDFDTLRACWGKAEKLETLDT